MSNFNQKVFLPLVGVFILLALLCGTATADEPVPDWLSKSAAMPIPSYQEKEVPAVVLYKEQSSNLDMSGKLTVTENYAVKMLTKDGKYFADASAFYLMSSSKVKDIKAWLIRPNGTVKFYGKDAVIDLVSDPDDIYNEYRVKRINAREDADVGYVFGYQTITEEKPIFTEDYWAFQNSLPTLAARYTLNLPSGWEAKYAVFNRENVAPTINGTFYTWELRDLKPIPPEESSPSPRRLSPTLAVRYFPTTKSGTRIFESWEDVSRWGTELHTPQVIVDDAVAKKARELTANANSEFEKIRAVANFVQNLQYISVDIGVAYGNGYRPRPSNMVLARGYGDCKDKANLMRAMLKSLNIESFPVFIFSGDPTFVRAEWSSPSQFNHCIIAVKVNDTTQSQSVINHPKLGRLLVFDATDPFTVLGDFPLHEQGSLALIAAGDNGGIFPMPKLSAETNRFERFSEVVIDRNGGLTGKISERATGQTASRLRRLYRSLSAADFAKAVENRLSRNINGIKINEFAAHDLAAKMLSDPADKTVAANKSAATGKFDDTRFDLQIDFSAASYAQTMQGRLMVFKPAIIGRLDQMYFQEDRRRHPFLLDAVTYTETVGIKIPDGFIVDEVPESTAVKSEFGEYTTNFEVKPDSIVFTRSLNVREAAVAPEKFDDLRKFFGMLRHLEESPVVLVKK